MLPHMPKRDFEGIEGVFHDGLGTFAELSLANQLITLGDIAQRRFDLTFQQAKMETAIDSLPQEHPKRIAYPREIANIERAAAEAASMLLDQVARTELRGIEHVARDYAGAKGADLLLSFPNRPPLPGSVKTDKSGRQRSRTDRPRRFARSGPRDTSRLVTRNSTASCSTWASSRLPELKAHYLNVAEFVVEVMIRKLQLSNCSKTDLSYARTNNINAVKHVLSQLLVYKNGTDNSRVVILSRTSGQVIWETLLDTVDIDSLTSSEVSFRPSRPKFGRRVGSEFAVKVDGRAVVTFQVKHQRGAVHGTAREQEFRDITTRLTL